MPDCLQFYIDGEWTNPAVARTMDVINPATEAVCGRLSLGSSADVDRAAKAARKAFASFAQTSRQQRLDLLKAVIAEYQKRQQDMAEAITLEMGAPRSLAQYAQAPMGLAHFAAAAKILENYPFEERRGSTLILREPIGVCGFITPWNWPINQIACKLAPALATGCAIILKPSELAPFSAQIMAQILDAAGAPAGVFNLVHGDGAGVGAAISGHREIDLVSFTGSTRAGVEVARNAAPTIKRVHQELGGKSPNIILEDADFEKAVSNGVKAVMTNSGQSCNAPTRMLVPKAKMPEAIEIARRAAQATRVGDPNGQAQMGPVVSHAQWLKIQNLIEQGMKEGAKLVAGGPGKPEGLERGYFVKPTVFADVENSMTIAREEIFGPVLTILGYDDLDDAIAIANDTDYGLAAYVWSADPEKAAATARRLRAGQVNINGAAPDIMAPFGGYKMSGNGREWGEFAFAEFLEIKAVLGAGAR